MLSDWLGNKYDIDEQLEEDCQFPGCTKEAVRNPCLAEGYEGKTHWAGWVHVFGDEPKFLCEEHGELVNTQWKKLILVTIQGRTSNE